MARIIPSGWKQASAIGSFLRELETLEQLAGELPDDYTIYHGLHWSRIQGNQAKMGEVDFAIVAPNGALLLIEQKCGFLKESADGLAKLYGEKEKSIPFQIGRAVDALHKRLGKIRVDTPFSIDTLLYCPDYTVKQPGSAGIPPERIVDAPKRTQLGSIIRAILPLDRPEHPDILKLHQFLADELNLIPDVQAIVGQASVLYTTISGGLAHWARQIHCAPFRLRVTGTAGSGKTQLALAVFRDAIAAKRRPLYVCYNRPLADHFARIVPAGGVAMTYHQLADQLMRTAGKATDFRQPGAFFELERHLDEYTPERDGLFDELIIDEGQDFKANWKDNLLRMLRPEGRAWWLEDPLQNLYDRPYIELPGWVSLKSDINFRSPQDVLSQLNRLLTHEQRVVSGSPLAGSDVEIITYSTPSDLLTQTRRAITQGFSAGFKREEMAIITFRGKEKSALTPFDHLGSFPLKTFTGSYDIFGNPIFTEGDLLTESIYRFKGQSAPCVIFTEIDFDSLDDLVLRKLFVGMTRATLKLILVLSDKAAQSLLERLNESDNHQ